MREPIRLRYIHHFKGLSYPSRWSERLMALKDPETELETEAGDDAFIEFVEQTYETELAGVQFARDAKREEDLGRYDAICNACGAEPGVKAARELCETLVMGPACAAMHVASMLGRRFSYLIAGGESDDPSAVDHARENITSLAERYGLAHKLASVRAVAVTPLGFREDLITDHELATLKRETLAAALAAVHEDGADVVVGYGGPDLHDFLVEELRPLGVPVISPDLALLKVTEMLVRLGVSQSKRTHPTPRRFYDFEIESRAVVATDADSGA